MFLSQDSVVVVFVPAKSERASSLNLTPLQSALELFCAPQEKRKEHVYGNGGRLVTILNINDISSATPGPVRSQDSPACRVKKVAMATKDGSPADMRAMVV